MNTATIHHVFAGRTTTRGNASVLVACMATCLALVSLLVACGSTGDPDPDCGDAGTSWKCEEWNCFPNGCRRSQSVDGGLSFVDGGVSSEDPP